MPAPAASKAVSSSNSTRALPVSPPPTTPAYSWPMDAGEAGEESLTAGVAATAASAAAVSTSTVTPRGELARRVRQRWRLWRRRGLDTCCLGLTRSDVVRPLLPLAGSCNRNPPIDCRGGGPQSIKADIAADLRGRIYETTLGSWQPKCPGRSPTRIWRPPAPLCGSGPFRASLSRSFGLSSMSVASTCPFSLIPAVALSTGRRPRTSSSGTLRHTRLSRKSLTTICKHTRWPRMRMWLARLWYTIPRVALRRTAPQNRTAHF